MYQRKIATHLAKTDYVGRCDARHVQAWMRLAHDTLDHLTRRQFEPEIDIARSCIDADRAGFEALAQSCGLSSEG